MSFSRFIGTLAVLLAGPLLAHAADIVVPNFSFETPGGNHYQNNNNNSTFIPNWIFSDSGSGGTASGSQLIQINSNDAVAGSSFFSAGTSDGSSFGFMNLESKNSTPQKGTITSAASLGTILSGALYTLTVSLGNNEDADTANYGNTGIRTINLLANGVAVATTMIADSTEANGTWQDYSITLNTALQPLIVGQALTIQLSGVASSSTKPEAADFDNVRLTEAAVPEPSVWTMMAPVVVVGILFLARRSRRLEA